MPGAGAAEEDWGGGVSSCLDCDSLSSLYIVHVYVVCRRGNDSQMAVQLLQRHNEEVTAEVTVQAGGVCIRDILGGLVEWTNAIDPHFPKY